MTEDILSMGCLPVPAEAKDYSSATTFDGAYVVKHVLHPTDGMTSSRLQNKATGVSVRERKHRTRLRRRAAIEMTTSLVTGDTIKKCTCINSRGQLVKYSSDVPCDHPCCMAPYLISYSIKGKKYDSHVLASHDNYHGTLMRRAAAKEPSLGTHGEHSWEGYSDVSPALMQMLNESWR
jgi:hypothetical protein